MARFFKTLTAAHHAFIDRQKIFFVASAMPEGRINLSPKGMDTFRVLDAHTVCFLNLTGSGNETAAHLSASTSLTLMFCSFEKKPLILRLYGQGRVVSPHDAAWSTYLPHFPDLPGKRQVILLTVDQVQTSCGYAVPFFEFKGEREQLTRWADKKGEAGIRAYWADHNQTSLDGLPIPGMGAGSV